MSALAVHGPPAAATLARDAFWRLPHGLRRALFRRLRPRLAAHYQAMREGRAGEYDLRPMLERGVLFVHIPKCAGIAVCRALYGGLGGGHLPLAHYQLVFGAAEYARLYRFAVVRNPFARLLSAYRFLASGGLNAHDAAWAARHLPPGDFNAFVERWLTPARARASVHLRAQVDFLRVPGTAGLAVDFLARQESLAADFERLCAQRGLHLPAPGQHNRSAASDEDYRAVFSPAAVRVAAAVYAQDLRALGYAFEHPAARVPA